jgi:hypothetical protein
MLRVYLRNSTTGEFNDRTTVKSKQTFPRTVMKTGPINVYRSHTAYQSSMMASIAVKKSKTVLCLEALLLDGLLKTHYIWSKTL